MVRSGMHFGALNKKRCSVLFDYEHPCSQLLRPALRSLPESLSGLRDIELYLLALLQAAEAARLNRREMHEDILATLPADEAKALRVVKPL